MDACTGDRVWSPGSESFTNNDNDKWYSYDDADYDHDVLCMMMYYNVW